MSENLVSTKRMNEKIAKIKMHTGAGAQRT